MNKVIRKLLQNKKSINQLISCHCTPYVTRKSIHDGPTTSQLHKVAMPSDQHKLDSNNINKFTERTVSCGFLNKEHVGMEVTLFGWLEYFRMGKFLVLRDGYGQTQMIIDANDKDIQGKLEKVPYESVLRIQGTVLLRPEDMINSRQTTGEIEVLIKQLDIINEASQHLPFNIREFQKAKEPLRMQYRYLDMRFSNMQRNLRVRSEMLMKMREYLVNECGFVDVETPTLFKATPGGAQEFIVPTRFPGQFYSLVQSPQQFKQMLMAGAIDRYFQIARCYRDETSRPDRQPEFTQLDIELSFTNRNSVLSLVEELMQYSWPSFLEPLPCEFPRMTHTEAMSNYGTDKPDTRFDFKLQDCSAILGSNSQLATKTNFHAACLIFDEPYNNLTKSIREKLSLNQFPETQMVLQKVKSSADFVKKTEKLLGAETRLQLFNEMKLKENSIFCMVMGQKQNTLKRLGKIRLDYVNHLEATGIKIRKPGMHFLWVIDFPLFEEGDQPGTLLSAHHPFTAAQTEDYHLLKSSPLEVRGQSYDLVLNGNEIAGGSIRIHNKETQEYILQLLKIKTHSLQHMLDMLASGCPPHGGIAIGLDRLLAVILETPSIRDVIAFPKKYDGRDPLSGAPTMISEEDAKLYNIKPIQL